MGSFRKFTLAVAALAATASFANAADIIETPIYETPEVVTKAAGGWYLRGDAGWAHMKSEGVTYYQGTSLTGSFEEHDLGTTWMLGGGIGYEVNDYFRVDVTGNYYMDAEFNGSSATGAACNGQTILGEICDFEDDSSVHVSTLMANGYIDLGNFSGWTPYVGAGIGGAHVKWGTLINDETCVLNCVGYVEQDTTHEGVDGWRFAWAAHAGVSYDLTHNLKLDAGYSYTSVEGGQMFNWDAVGGTGPQGFDGDLSIHTVRAGLRYTFN